MARPQLCCLALAASLLLFLTQACRKSSPPIGPAPDVRVNLSRFGLPHDYLIHDAEIDCTSHVIGYRFLVWLTDDRLALGFNISPSCRPSSGRAAAGLARILVFDLKGDLQASRDLPYDADGGEELVAPGEAMRGPAGTLLFRIEEAGRSKSGVLLLDPDLKDVGRIDRLLERDTLVDHALVFQEGFVLTGPRTYDIFTGRPLVLTRKTTEDWPVGTMDRQFGTDGVAYMLCRQELQPGVYAFTDVIYSGAHRRCVMNAAYLDGARWRADVEQDGVAELIGLVAHDRVLGIIRVSKRADQLVLWKRDRQLETLPWFPVGYDTEFQGVSEDLARYQGFGRKREGRLCDLTGLFCQENNGELAIFDRGGKILSSGAPSA